MSAKRFFAQFHLLADMCFKNKPALGKLRKTHLWFPPTRSWAKLLKALDVHTTSGKRTYNSGFQLRRACNQRSCFILIFEPADDSRRCYSSTEHARHCFDCGCLCLMVRTRQCSVVVLSLSTILPSNLMRMEKLVASSHQT